MLFYGGMNLELFIGFQLPVNVFPDLAIAASLNCLISEYSYIFSLQVSYFSSTDQSLLCIPIICKPAGIHWPVASVHLAS